MAKHFFIPGEDFESARVLKGGTGCPDSGVYIGVVTKVAAAAHTKTPANFDVFVAVPGYDYDKLSVLVSVAHDIDGNPIEAVAAKAGGRTNGAYTFAVHCGIDEETLKADGLDDEDLIGKEVGLWIETAYSKDGEVALYAQKVKSMTVEDAEQKIADGVEVPRHKAPDRENRGPAAAQSEGRTRATRRAEPEPEPESEPEAPVARRRAAPVEEEPEPEAETRTRVRRRRPPPQ